MNSPRSTDVALIVGLLIPVAMILFIAGAIYLPRAFSRVEPPAHDFLYLVGYPYGPERFVVVSGRLTREEVEEPRSISPHGTPEIQFFVHHVSTNTSTRLSFDEAAQLSLDNGHLSPDGYEIVHGRRAEFFFPIVSSTDYRTRYLKKDSHTIKLDLAVGSDGGYSSTFIFLGWILEEAQWTN